MISKCFNISDVDWFECNVSTLNLCKFIERVWYSPTFYACNLRVWWGRTRHRYQRLSVLLYDDGEGRSLWLNLTPDYKPENSLYGSRARKIFFVPVAEFFEPSPGAIFLVAFSFNLVAIMCQDLKVRRKKKRKLSLGPASAHLWTRTSSIKW